MTTKLLLIAVVSLVAGPLLAGCADNDGTTPTPTTATSMTPTTPASPTSPTSPTVPTVPTIPTISNPLSPALNLKIGLMNPMTGGLSNLGPSMQKGMELAVEDVNAQAALTGLSVTIVGREDDTTGDQPRATAAYDRLVGLGATVIAGPCCSGVTGAVLTKAVEDEVLVATPSATSPFITETDRDGFFWRVVPNDALQGRVLAPLVREDGHARANMIVVNNDYGNGFAKVFKQVFEADGGTVGTISKVAEQQGATVASQVTEACSGEPDAVVLVVYTKDGAEIIKAMQAQGCLSRIALYASEGIYSPVLAGSVVDQAGKDGAGKYLAEGMKGSTPQPVNTSEFNAKYDAKYNEAPQQYAPESYDAIMYVVLGALKAKSVEGRDISEALLDIANPAGTKCRAFAQCAALILAGQDIDYQGYAHDFEFSELHEPATGIYSHWEVTGDGMMTLTRQDIEPEQ